MTNLIRPDEENTGTIFLGEQSDQTRVLVGVEESPVNDKARLNAVEGASMDVDFGKDRHLDGLVDGESNEESGGSCAQWKNIAR